MWMEQWNLACNNCRKTMFLCTSNINDNVLAQAYDEVSSCSVYAEVSRSGVSLFAMRHL